MEKISRIILVSITLFSLSFFGNTQNTQGKVVSIFSLGVLDYSIILENSSNEYFQTSPYGQGELSVDQIVTLESIDENQSKVISENLTTTLYASKISSSSPEQPSISLMPIVDKNMLFFVDTAHYRRTYDELNGYNGDLDEDEYFDLFEANFNTYTSYRNFFNTKWNFLDGEFTDRELEDIYSEEIIPDDLKKTLLNENRMVGIGDKIIYQHELGQYVTIDKNNEEALNVLLEIENGSDLFDLKNGKYGHYEFEISVIDTKYPPKAGVHIITPNQLKYESYAAVQGVECNVTRKLFRVDVIRATFNGNSWTELGYDVTLNGSISISWGDNTNESLTYEFLNGAGWVTHDYAQVGTYYITYSYSFQDGDGNNVLLQDVFPIVVSNDLCGEGVKNIPGSAENGTWKMKYRTWFDSETFFGGSEGGCYTHAWKKVGNKWKRKKADIMAEVTVTWRNTNGCYVGVLKNANSHHTNQKKVRKVKNLGANSSNNNKFGHDAVKSMHYLQKNGTYLERHVTIGTC